MERYQNLSGNSGVAAYQIADEAITVKFIDGGVYVYTYASAGRDKVEEMKRCALAGRGLSSYISRHASDAYASKH